MLDSSLVLFLLAASLGSGLGTCVWFSVVGLVMRSHISAVTDAELNARPSIQESRGSADVRGLRPQSQRRYVVEQEALTSIG